MKTVIIMLLVGVCCLSLGARIAIEMIVRAIEA